MLTWRKEWRINVNAEVSINVEVCMQGGVMLDRDEHAEAMSQVIEKVYGLDLLSPLAWYMRILTTDLKAVFTTDIKLAIVMRLWVLIWGGKRRETSVSYSLSTWTVEGSYKFQWRCWQMHTWEVGCIFQQDCSFYFRATAESFMNNVNIRNGTQAWT